MRYGHVSTLRHAHPVSALCRALAVSESGYHAWRKRSPSPRAQLNARLETEILAAHERTRQTYGPERLQADLADHGVRVGVHRIKRLRRKLGLRCKQKRKFIATTDSAHALPVAKNVLNREFAVTAPNKVWVTDITYIATDEGWLYLAGVKDVFNGELVGYSMADNMTCNLVTQALFRAVTHKRPPNGLIHHSDRGSQYCAHDYQKMLQQFGIKIIGKVEFYEIALNDPGCQVREGCFKMFNRFTIDFNNFKIVGLPDKVFCQDTSSRPYFE